MPTIQKSKVSTSAKKNKLWCLQFKLHGNDKGSLPAGKLIVLNNYKTFTNTKTGKALKIKNKSNFIKK